MSARAPAVETFGCRLNIWESEVIAAHAGDAGLDGETVIINTCAVTRQAEKDARAAIRRHHRRNPAARIVVTGCAAQIAPEAWRGMAGVHAVIGNHEKLQSRTWNTLARRNDPAPQMMVADIMQVRETSPHLLESFDSRSRGFLQIQQGCDHRCTFCIIPYGRGNNRSVAARDIVMQIRALAESGLAEMVLTGVDIACWGNDLPGRPRLGALVRRILREVPALKRLRLSSIDPAVLMVDGDLRAAIADEARLMPHLHLSVQHGDGLILKRMKRRHCPDDILRITDDLRRARPDIVFGADMIAGFPTENDSAHRNSLALIEAAGLTWLHVFPYSPRPGTPAARMPQCDSATIKSRAAELRALGKKRQGEFLTAAIGGRDEILLESGGIGHLRQFAKARLDNAGATRHRAGAVFPVRITGLNDDVLVAEAC